MDNNKLRSGLEKNYKRFCSIVDSTILCLPKVFELFFCKKIPLSRRVEYVMDGSTDQ